MIATLSNAADLDSNPELQEVLVDMANADVASGMQSINPE